jgi:alpha-mannosidase II
LVLGNALSHSWSDAIVDGKVVSWYDDLVHIRRNLASIQHHDAITGTSRSSVVTSYLEIIKTSLEMSRDLIGWFSSVVVYGSLKDAGSTLSMLESQESPQTLPQMTPVSSDSKLLVFFNPLAHQRSEIVRIVVTSVDVQVTDTDGVLVRCQLNPVWDNQKLLILSDRFEVYFEVTVSPLGTAHYVIRSTPPGNKSCQRANVKIFSKLHLHHLQSPFAVQWHAQNSPMSISTDRLIVNFCSCSHLMESIIYKPEMIPYRAQMEFVTYSTGEWLRPYADKSGAYIFQPNGPSRELQYSDHPAMMVVEGDMMSMVTSWLSLVATQTVTIFNTSGIQGSGVYITNNVSLNMSVNNTEIAMKLTTSISSGDDFYTDVNGFQVHRRKMQHRLPIQGNFHPMTATVFLEDTKARMTLLSVQSHGVSSLESGSVEVILDRRLAQDDWRGLGEGVIDNLPSSSQFIVLFEPFYKAHPTNTAHSTVGYLSLIAHYLSDALSNPIIPLLSTEKSARSLVPANFVPVHSGLPCDVQLLNLRSVSRAKGTASLLMLLHRVRADCNVKAIAELSCAGSFAEIMVSRLLEGFDVKSVEETTVTGGVLTSKSSVNLTSTLVVPAMEIRTWKISFRYQR